MTTDVIASARRRTRRLLLTVLGVTGLLAAAVYPAGWYVNSRLDAGRAATSPPAPPWPAATRAVTLALPADLTWVTVAGVVLPVSAIAGPRHEDRGLAYGFAHSPAGAVLAALHLLVRTTPQVGSAVFAPTLTRQVVGEHAAAMHTVVADDYRQMGGDPVSGAPVGSLPAALAGLRLTAYTPTAAVIDLLTTAADATGTARFAATTVHVRWTGADWALVAPPEGRWDALVRAVTADQAAAYPPLGPPGEGR